MNKIIKVLVVTLIFTLSVFLIFVQWINMSYPVKYGNYISEFSMKYSLDPILIYSIINTESGFDPEARSHANAIGLMQLQKKTAMDMAKDNTNCITDLYLTDPAVNIEYGCKYLSWLLAYYKGNMKCALCAYNAGLGNINNWLNCAEYVNESGELIKIPFEETKNYIERIENNYKIYNIFKKIGKISN